MNENNEFEYQNKENNNSNEQNTYGYYNQNYSNQNDNNQPTYNIPHYTPVEQPKKENSGYAIASLVLGILSILCCGSCGIIMGILAIAFYFVDKNNSGQPNALARAGMICGIIAIVCSVIYLILYATVLAGVMQDLMNEMMNY